MPILREVFPFTARLIGGAPEQPGVYVLWQDGETIYIGAALGGAATIRSRLVEHFSGNAGDCTRRASHYSWEIASDPGSVVR
jgi:excinuclease UvrABC nuclease subunit